MESGLTDRGYRLNCLQSNRIRDNRCPGVTQCREIANFIRGIGLARINMNKAIVGILVGALATGAMAQTYDAANDFSAANNPNGVWTFGYENTFAGAFNVSTNQASGSGIDSWRGNNVGDGNPGAYHNSLGTTVDIGTVEWDPNQLILHPGPSGEYSIARFTAPTTGLYTVSASFIGQDDGQGTTTDVHVLQNNVSVYDNLVLGFHNANSTSFTTTLTAGDTLDAAVGFGPNNNFGYDSTGVGFTIQAAPEPGTIAVLVLGGIGLLRKRRKQA